MSKFSDLESYLAHILRRDRDINLRMISELEERLDRAIKDGNKFRDLLLEHFNLEVVNHPEKTTLEKKKIK
ncbi:MAG: hypothetical protein PHV97_00620 [Candidatus Omnitrophica bacterium]|nr:hypothetical protein [Candidatus Omnitrophota bacterium]